MIEFYMDPEIDSRVVNGKVDIKKLERATKYHIYHVQRGLSYIADMLIQVGTQHDYTKLTHLEEFHKAVESGNTRKSKWYKMHSKAERHHLSKPPEDVNLVDVLEHIVDCVMSGTARQEEIFDIHISDETLKKAYKNTVKLIQDQIKIVEVKDHGEYRGNSS